MLRYLFYALKRSGHHAVIFWLLGNEGTVAQVLTGRIFYSVSSDTYFYNDNSIFKYNITNNCRFKVRNYENVLPGPEFPLEPNALDHTPLPEAMRNMRVIVLRDFLNLMASTQEHFVLGNDPDSYLPNVIERWKAFARLFHNTTNQGTVCVNYNKWLTSREYRDIIAHALGFENRDRIEPIDHPAGSSSWRDPVRRIDQYLNRYKSLKLRSDERNLILQDAELINFNRDIFGLDLAQMLANPL